MTLHNVKGCVVALTTVAAAALAFASCTKEAPSQDPAPGSDYTLEECVFQAVGDTAATKTVISDLSKGTVTWQEGDKVAIFSVDKYSGDSHEFTTEKGGDKATFEGEIESGTTSFVAVYPYSSSVTYEGGTFSNLTIPVSQTPTADSFAPGASLSYATGSRVPGGDCSDLTFSNLCAVICFTLPSNITFAKTITVSANNGANIAGAVSLSGGKLSGGSSKTVTLSGGFEAGHSYCVAILPGTYAGGFTFNIATNGNNSYTRSTTKDCTAAAGGLYSLGKLSLILSSNDFTSSVSLTNTVSDGELKGTDANLTITPKTEIAGIIKSYKYSVTFYTGSTEYRKLTDCTTKPTSVKLDVSDGKPYIPHGTYDYRVTLYYTTNNGEKDIERGPIILIGTATQDVPSELPITATLTGYTSYSVYKGDDKPYYSDKANTANGCDNATIYNIGATYAGGVSSAVLTQLGTSVTIKSYLDKTSSEVSGDQGSQSWASHTIGANWSFDGASGTCASTKTVHVTGLPWTDSKPSSGKWSLSTNCSSQDYGLKLGGGTGEATATLRDAYKIYAPADISVSVYCSYGIHTLYWYLAYQKTTFTIKVSGTQILSRQGEKLKNTYNDYTDTKDATIKSSNNSIVMNSSYTTAGPYARIYQLKITYR